MAQDLVSDTLFADHYELVFGVACTGAGYGADAELRIESSPLARALHRRDVFPIHHHVNADPGEAAYRAVCALHVGRWWVCRNVVSGPSVGMVA